MLIYLVAGEHSGDVLGARLMLALRAARPEVQFAGIGGPRMEAAGLQTLGQANGGITSECADLEDGPGLDHVTDHLQELALEVAGKHHCVAPF